VIVPETGVIVNNEMNDFCIPGYVSHILFAPSSTHRCSSTANTFEYIPSLANFIWPFKRPLSSISPIIIETATSALYYVTGVSRIITATIQNIWYVLDQHMSAPARPARAPTSLNIQGCDNATVVSMQGLGHNVSRVPPGQSAVQGIRRLSNGTFEAAAEPRQYASGGLAF
jgi:gamma-glutamyltranspeptidase / glutathione hydrolase